MPATRPTSVLTEAEALRRRGRPAEALRVLLPAVTAAPREPTLWLALGGSALELGQLPEAERAYRRALELRPGDRDGLIGLGLVRQTQGEHAEARERWEEASAQDGRDPVPPSLLGVNLMRAGSMAEAESWFRLALRRRPGHPDALAGLASILERSGRAAEGAALLAPAAAAAHPHGAVAAILARCLMDEDRHAEALEVLERSLAGDPDPPRQVQLEHLRGEALECLDRAEEAFAAYARANSLRTARFDGARHLAAVRQMIGRFDAATLSRLPRGANRSRRSLLVVGMPRSGTSLIERMLKCHPRIAGAGELDTWRLLAVSLTRRWGLPQGAIWYDHLDRLEAPLLDELGASYLADLDEHATSETALVVDKMPHNVFQLPLAALALPGTVVVHAVRDPLDTGWSCFRQNFTDGLPWATSLEGIALYLRAERELMAHWKRVLELPVITLRYEELTADPRRALAPLLTAAGLDWDERILDFHRDGAYVATASYRDLRRPLYRDAVGRAGRFATQLAPLRRLLAALGPLPE